jgi:hypothetical protein
MLALAPGVAYIHEPFNPRTSAGISPAPFDRYFTVVTAENEERYLPGLERTLAFRYDLGSQLGSQHAPRDLARAGRDFARSLPPRLSRARPLVKDPIALLSAEWLADRFGMEVVVLVRHPAAFAASLKRLGWSHDFGSFVVDGRLPEAVRKYEAEIREQSQRPGDVFAQASLLWRILYGAVEGYRARHPEWTYLRHEDASADPLGTFELLYSKLGLELAPGAARDRAGDQRLGQPGGAALPARREACERGEPRPLAHAPHARGDRVSAGIDARCLAELLHRRGLVAEARERVGRAQSQPVIRSR